MKTETNLILRSMVEQQRANLINARNCVINRITGSTMSDDETEDAAFNLSEIGQKIRDFDDALTALRTEESKKQPPTLSEKTVELIRHLLEIYLRSTNEMSDQIKCILPLIPAGEKLDKISLNVKTKMSEATTALKEFGTAYPKKPESK